MDQLLDRKLVQKALERVNDVLRERGQRADLFVVGGAVICLVHDARPSTRDVDAWFTNPAEVRRAARLVAEELELPDAWLNDAAKGFVPANAGFNRWQELSHLSISTADERTLLPMKCCASRTDEDMEDIRFLAKCMGLRSSEEALAVVLEYFPADRLPVRARLLLEEMLDDGK
jgi:hypothetical protein